MSASVQEKGSAFSGINVTPLTDVMLVLLITFLLSANSFESRTLSVPLPQVLETREIEKHACVIGVEAGGTVIWPEDSVSGLALKEAMLRLRDLRSEKVLAIGVHRDCPYEKLFPVAQAAVDGGWTRVVLLTEEAE